jgi:protein gp37
MVAELRDWSPVIGCASASPGCENCRAIIVANGAMQNEFREHGLTKQGAVEWTGRTHIDATRLREPLECVERTVFAVVPFGDLFFESVPEAWIDLVFSVMEQSPRHAFQLQTKRARRMRDYVAARYSGQSPPRNLFLGVNVESQDYVSRIDHLLETPAAARYLTIFPPMSEIDLTPYLATGRIAQVLVGQEPWRPSKAEWVERIQRDCVAHNVPYTLSDRLVGEVEAAA